MLLLEPPKGKGRDMGMDTSGRHTWKLRPVMLLERNEVKCFAVQKK